MTRRILLTLICAMLTLGLLARGVIAADAPATAPAPAESEKTIEQQMEEFVKLGPGVPHVTPDDQGRVKTLIVVGQARISTVLGQAKGLELARTKARQSAAAEFVKWLGEKAQITLGGENETIIYSVGTEGAGKANRSESGKALEKNSEEFKSAASGLVRGLSLLHSDVNGKEKTVTLVFGWSAERAKAAKHLATHDATLEKKGTPKAPKTTKRESEEQPATEAVPSKKATSSDAGDFLK